MRFRGKEVTGDSVMSTGKEGVSHYPAVLTGDKDFHRIRTIAPPTMAMKKAIILRGRSKSIICLPSKVLN